ncbi:hypothetical protein H257_14404 [Aphanomyces astaci]|uniref:Uncharacterized protein n=1 Tax=Aphanomyces astaci TaxID=112090 RepID=W4FTB6_APHAT|nr:hypothetical protein H257_14404 [Aphanomyces astaci]ETV70064.1 hypothetical protein H257_14404 [Aphanomyces astaci]|eukprot:XP_009840507.1 hypothetical protein H257_14404 [Aphanomyces astaci]
MAPSVHVCLGQHRSGGEALNRSDFLKITKYDVFATCAMAFLDKFNLDRPPIHLYILSNLTDWINIIMEYNVADYAPHAHKIHEKALQPREEVFVAYTVITKGLWLHESYTIDYELLQLHGLTLQY